MDVGEKVKELRKSLGLTQEDFGRKIGVAGATISNIEKGFQGSKKGIGAELLSRLSKTYKVDLNWLLLGDDSVTRLPLLVAEPGANYDSKSALVAIPVINEVPAGYPGYPQMDDEIHGFLYLPGISRHCFGLFVRGESMLPELADQDIVVVDPFVKSVEKGKIGVFRVNGDATIKICMPLEEEKGYILQPRNPNFQPILITDDSECTVIGKVIYKIVKCQ